MPYKARLKTGEPRKRAKPGYAVTNAHEYNESLKRRGQLSLYCPVGDLKALFINDTPYQKGVSGQSRTYSDAYLELIFIFYRLFGWGMRQITGHMHEFRALRGLDIGVPSFGLLSERFRTLEVQVKQRCARVAERLRNGEAISLIVDSSGMSFGRASEWHRQKYGRDASQTPWRKMHLSIDPEMNVHQIAITEDNVSDEAGLNAMLAVDANVDCVIADGAYYSIAQTEARSACGVLPVIPPPANAVVHNQPATRWHDHLVRYIKDKGIHAFRNKYGYGQRALVEAQISRIKRCIGARLLTRKTESQQREGVIIANLVNLWNSFGKAVCVKNA
ncbi:IS5 family transposase [Paraburkholderia sp. JPY303]|uniref:IS5 family transposase n=1 Tax=Paraburkholderia atlantica TaxID=2654982 RepID=UPI001592326B|nr:IS5 family transposase [Paraburkholderia atlantica]NUY36158.1 IS5 family transposase [Paraburkholderia atlantica]